MPYLYSPPRSPTTLHFEPPKMLLRKPLTTFLSANRTPFIHTLLLVTPNGKLLSSSSPHPASQLRAQATLACSLSTLFKPITAAGTITATLPSKSYQEDDDNEEAVDDDPRMPDPAVTSILVQCELGIMVVRVLKCSLLFVVIGPASLPSLASAISLPSLTQNLSHLSVRSATSPPPSSHSGLNGEGVAERPQDGSFANVNGLGSSAASITGSSSGAGTGTGTGTGKFLRRQSEELAKWLDGELESFALSTGL